MEHTPLEWLGMSHMSVLGACCAHAYFEKEVYFGCMPIFGEGSIFGERLVLRKT
jgi:hypothetical protein